MPRRILIIDPNRVAAERLARELAEHQLDAQHAPSWATALQLAEQFKPDVAIVDTGLLPQAGADWADRLRSLMAAQGLLIGATEYSQSLAAQAGTTQAPTAASAAAATEPAIAAEWDAHFYKPVPMLRFLLAIED